MTSISVGTNDRKKGTVAEVFDESLIAELFNLLWGQERSVMPTVVDYAYEEIWKRVIMIGGSEEQRLSDVTLSEQLGMSRTPVRQALERLVQEGLVRSDPRRGFWTSTFSAQDIHEIYDLRGAQESMLRSQLSMFQMQDTFYPERMAIALNDHEQVLLALLAGNVEEAADCLARHIRNAKEGVLADIFFERKEDV